MKQQCRYLPRVIIGIDVIAGVVVFAISLLVASAASAASTVTARTCNSTDVQAAINAAKDGDTVQVPAGRCSWTTQVDVIQKALTIQGAGMGQTIILDNISNTITPLKSGIFLSTVGTKFVRLTGFEFDGTATSGSGGPGIVQVGGNGTAWRIDHNRFRNIRAYAIYASVGGWGVIDHNEFLASANNHTGPRLFHSTFEGVGSSGHNSYAQPPQLGTEKAIFVEDNVFFNTYVPMPASISPHQGARVVFRYNTVTNGFLGSHGTEGESNRSQRILEVYNNTFTATRTVPWANFQRGGAGVMWGNTLTGPFTAGAVLEHYRLFTNFNRYGICDGRNPYDLNAPGGPFQTGTATSGSSGLVLADTSKAWTPNQWAGYSIRNTSTNISSIIKSNTATTATVEASANPPSMSFAAGHTYQFWKAIACLDQIGYGQTNLMTGSNPVLPQAWTNGQIEGMYFWDNTLNGGAFPVVNRRPKQMVEGVHVFSNTRKPGYTPYVYPHPLVNSTIPSPPSNFRAQN